MLSLSLAAAMGGCFSAESRQQMADANSVLAPLMKSGTPTPAVAAAWAADPYSADKRARGMNLLANAPFGGAEPYVALYRERLSDESPPVRSVAARALALHGQPEDVVRIIPLTKEENIAVRMDATRALQRLHNPAAVPALLDRLNPDKETEPEIRAEAASALGQYAEPKVLQALMASLADPSLVVNMNALESLRTLTGNDELGIDRKAWVDWAKKTPTPFANQRAYVYPVFWREKRWLDYLPFTPPVPNEIASSPVGFTLDQPSRPPEAPAQPKQ